MASLKSLRNRIASVKATRKITKAQQMVAASKFRRALDAAMAARPYAEKMGAVITSLAGGLKDNPGAPTLLRGTGKADRHLLIVATADRGLCGGFNTNIVRLARLKIEELTASGKKVAILCVGRKGRDQLKRQYGPLIVDTIEFTAIKRIGFVNAQTIGKRVLQMFDEGDFDVATIIYSRFKSIISQIPTAQQLIPAPIGQTSNKADGLVYEYEPDEIEILADLLPRNVSVQIFHALLENVAGEFGAKMTAMDGATRNAGEVIDKLTLVYNRTRQAQITKELIEIISGAEAL
ncbi:MAG: F0F1 ATP synthase subunit gamma [Alphaproteobacteria bacterium]|nr:F0F1 ATP synthase subunit gamma [Alphaproteobacteria bacterium]MDE1987084.1 F0F1 ATP synthase subunit gamma [Alphaproteobacteria bacterium]MDE2163917.1 F0F1 ATP synthase subunit gamma [Alphaproteobacteria bacterium]MDE2264746.1 F0F1 ATP synthase subunit gamma [Alphaproteobacteria bacterium]MDE2500733.1 F0F1 ATP synthase subunit gamma [Alphaproteobacteria bacterium]